MRILDKRTKTEITIQEFIVPPQGNHLIGENFEGYLELCLESNSTLEMASVVRHDHWVVGSAMKIKSEKGWSIIPFSEIDVVKPYLNPKALKVKEFKVFYSVEDLGQSAFEDYA